MSFAFVLLLVFSLSGTILSKDVHFDYFVFTQQWPSAVCIEAQKAGHECSIPSDVKGWVIHGLWPSRNDNPMGPFFCNNSKKFDVNKLQSIEDDLRTFWPNLFADSPDLSFWKHEWKKHGTCSLTDKLIPDELTYFKTALNLNRKLNITSYLGESGIIPNTYTPYKRDDFCNAIIKALGVVPVITCIQDRHSRHNYILQVEICVDKDLKATDCPMKHSTHHRNHHHHNHILMESPYKHNQAEGSCARCSSKAGIWYPTIEPTY